MGADAPLNACTQAYTDTQIKNNRKLFPFIRAIGANFMDTAHHVPYAPTKQSSFTPLKHSSNYTVTYISVAGKRVPAKKNSWPTISKGLSIARQ
jgi:hypothetical protein